ncbi:MAG: NFACT RNA binding domain-containing protein [Nanoarchaeota archaeon]|nr:NFACT RNA binding domain-containing protein [Nanoarchaeota archaeon]
MLNISNNYRKFRWFFTSSDKLVVGGKSSQQNEDLLKEIKSLNKTLIVMHTEDPGSPFTIILADVEKITKSDLEECAVFTACFSKAWKLGKKEAEVHIFQTSDLYKTKNMKEGTWGVIGNIKKIRVNLRLILVRQEGILRAVSEKTARSIKEKKVRLAPGKIDKDKLAFHIKSACGIEFDQQELLSAIPSGGFKILR